jgi:hypothetical protein
MEKSSNKNTRPIREILEECMEQGKYSSPKGSSRKLIRIAPLQFTIEGLKA